MKYIIFSFLLLGLASCSVPNPLDDDSEETASGISIEDTNSGTISESGTTESGALTGSGDENEENSGSLSEETTESGALDGTGETRHEEKDARTETGAKEWEKESDDKTKDVEVKNIQKDIDKIFEDIGKEGR